MNETTLSTGRKLFWGITPRKGKPPKLEVHYEPSPDGMPPSPDEVREAATEINKVLHPPKEPAHA